MELVISGLDFTNKQACHNIIGVEEDAILAYQIRGYFIGLEIILLPDLIQNVADRKIWQLFQNYTPSRFQ